MLRRLPYWIPIALALSLSAFTRPEVGDMVELQGALNGRSQARFRQQDDNHIVTLQRGTKAKIEQIQVLPSGNYGMKIRVLNSSGVRSEEAPSVWVYYNVQNPTLKLYAVNGNEQTIEKKLARAETDPKIAAKETQKPATATAAVIVKETQAIPQAMPWGGKTSAPHRAAPAPRAEQAPARTIPPQASDVVQTVQKLNQVATQTPDPQPVCRDCRARQAQYQQCSRNNSYLEQQMDRLGGRSVVSDLLSSSSKYPRLEACVRESMEISGGPFALCQIGNTAPSGSAPKACTSERLVKVVQNAFTLTMDCFAGYLNGAEGNQDLLRETLRGGVSLINLESGFHINAMSGTGAAGLGQMTNGATNAINKQYWPEMMAHMARSTNPSCQQLKRMNVQPAQPRADYSCQRMSLESGNPVVNMLYTIGHMKMVRKEVEIVLNRSLRENGIRLSPVFREQLLGALTTWGHNTGSYGITRPLQSLMQTSAGAAALNAGDLARTMSLLKSEVYSFHMYYGQRHGTGEARAREASGFYGFVQNKMNMLERKVGRTCSP